MAQSSLMQAVFYEQFGGRPTVKEVPVPRIGAQSVLLKVMATGICRSDWHGWMGHDPDIRLPHVPGHEFAGIIAELGSEVRRWKTGQRVTTPFIQACGRCDYCRSNDQQVCEFQEQAGFTHWGSFAEYVEVKHAETNLVELPPDMSFEQAAVLGCRFGTAYRALVDQAGLRAGDYLAVAGCGGVGLSAILIARAMKLEVAAIDVKPQALQRASACGAGLLLDASDPELAEQLWQWSGQGVTAFVDAVGSSQLTEKGLKALRRRGKYIQVGLMPDPVGKPCISLERVVAHELELIGSHGIQAWKYREMLDFIRTSGIDLDLMIERVCNLEESIEILTSLSANQQTGVTVVHPHKRI
jgi:alcohol dehydrogenase